MQNLFPSSFSDNKGRGAFDGAKSSKKKINRKIYRKAYRDEDYESVSYEPDKREY